MAAVPPRIVSIFHEARMEECLEICLFKQAFQAAPFNGFHLDPQKPELGGTTTLSWNGICIYCYPNPQTGVL